MSETVASSKNELGRLVQPYAEAVEAKLRAYLGEVRGPGELVEAMRYASLGAGKRIRPSLVVLMEGEVWPNFVSACRRRGVPVVVVNGRMSADKGYRGYKRLGPLARKLFNGVTAFGLPLVVPFCYLFLQRFSSKFLSKTIRQKLQQKKNPEGLKRIR